MRIDEEYVLQRLRLAGWYPERSIDTADYEQKLVSYGYYMSDAARRFLRSYGGLTIDYKGSFFLGLLSFYLSFSTDPMGAVDMTPPETIRDDYEQRVNTRLSLVGYKDKQDPIAIMIGDDNTFYIGWEYMLIYEGASAIEAFINIMKGRRGGQRIE